MISRVSTAIAMGSLLALMQTTVNAQSAEKSNEASTSSTATESTSRAPEGGVPIEKIIAAVAHKDGHKFLVDPRVRANVLLLGQDISNISLAQLQTILAVYGFETVESGGYVLILPDANARQVATPIYTGKESYPDAEVVSTVLQVKNISAAQLVPILRPLIPQYGHLAAYPATNSLILTDRFSNVKRILTLIKSMEAGEPCKSDKCALPPSAENH
jgi:general secretion pathway protein D